MRTGGDRIGGVTEFIVSSVITLETVIAERGLGSSGRGGLGSSLDTTELLATGEGDWAEIGLPFGCTD